MTTPQWILLVEDNDHDADLAIRALAADGWQGEVVHAADGVEALDCLHRRGPFQSRSDGLPSLVVLDLKMPRVDGFEVLGRIKGDVRLRNIPVVVFTSSRERTDLDRSYQLGVNAYVVKPVNLQQFTDALSEIKRFWLQLNEPAPEPALPRAVELPGEWGIHTATADAA
jgi:two-component system response regulator